MNKAPEDPEIKLTLVSQGEKSYYSGMLPGSVSGLYTDEDITIHLPPLAAWCRADFIDAKVTKIEGNNNRIILENNEIIEYDALAINVGSRTKDADQVKGVWEHSLTTRPINDLLPKIRVKEDQLKADGIIPEVVVCGAGAAGTELAMAFKARWSKFFGKEINVTLVGSHDLPVPEQVMVARENISKRLSERNVKYVGGKHIAEVKDKEVVMTDGTSIHCDVAIWATGAEAQEVTTSSDLDTLKGYFRVNKYL